MENRNIGMNTEMFPSDVKPRIRSPQPHWKIAVIRP